MNIESWGLSEKGFYCPTFDEILASKVKRAKELFGENISTDNNTALGKFLRIETAYDHKIFEELEKVYYSFSPVTAVGVSLDRAVSFAGMTRNTSVAAVHKIKIYGTANHVLKKGTLVKSSSGVVFYTTTDCTINEYTIQENDVEQYYAEVCVQAVEAGSGGNVYDINSLVDVDNDVTFIQYCETVTDGTDTERDVDLLRRYNDVVDGLGTNTKKSIISELMKINGVNKVIVCENITDTDMVISDDLTVESGKYAIIIYANSEPDDEIAEAIFNRKPFGIMQNGVEVVTVKDEAGEYHNVYFTYVKEKSVDVNVSCRVNIEFAAGGIEEIKANIEDYINNLDIGKPLIFSKLYQQIYAVAGTTDITELTVDEGTSSITPNGDEIIRAGDITVTVTSE